MEEPEPKRPKSYRIVLGTFGDPANADALVQDLLKDGYEPFVENKQPETAESAVQYRVLIGTFDDAADAGAVAEELRRLGYNAWLNTKT
jgi:cell division septation protein DedD